MPKRLKYNVKLFADDTSIFSIVKNKNYSTKNHYHDLSLISKWAFNLDSTKPAQEVIFSRKKDDSAHPNMFFNDILVERTSHQKHFGIYLYKETKFQNAS